MGYLECLKRSTKHFNCRSVVLLRKQSRKLIRHNLETIMQQRCIQCALLVTHSLARQRMYLMKTPPELLQAAT